LLIENRPPAEIRGDIDRIKFFFYKKLKAEAEERKNKFLEDGGKIEEYRAWVDPAEAKVKHLIDRYKQKKSDFNKVQEAEKYENLKKKYEIIDKIKDLVNREESINKTFHEFRSLQNEWHSVGVVPQSSLKDLWENYHHSVEMFYDYIKINKELRDLDLKKNLESKIRLCEKAEELLLEPNPVNAFRLLQDYHNHWREIGPVPPESKNEIWERFREATSQINKRHHEYFEKQKEEQKKNLEAKIALCEEVEAINLLDINTFKDFDARAEKLLHCRRCGEHWVLPLKNKTLRFTSVSEMPVIVFSKRKELSMLKIKKHSLITSKGRSIYVFRLKLCRTATTGKLHLTH
jgi:hypothetical protein